MAKWDFKIVGASFVKETVGSDVQFRSQSFMQPSFDLEGDKIVMKESGQYKTAISFTQIGEIAGVAPTDLEDAYDKLIDLVENFNGGEGTPQNLAQVLTQGDISTYTVPIPNNTFVTFDLGRELTENYFTTDDVGTGGLFLDKTIIFPENSTIPFQAGYVEDSVTPTPVTLLPYRFTTDAYVFYQGARVTDITIQPEDVCTLKWDGNNSTDGIQIWFLSIVSKNASLMLQFTQSGTSGPSIVTGSASGLRGASITSTSRVSDGDFRIVFSLPILADALDCYKNSATIPLNLIGDFGSSIINGWQFSIIDDYTVRVVSISDFFNTGALSDSVVGEPTLLEIKFKN